MAKFFLTSVLIGFACLYKSFIRRTYNEPGMRMPGTWIVIEMPHPTHQFQTEICIELFADKIKIIFWIPMTYTAIHIIWFQNGSELSADLSSGRDVEAFVKRIIGMTISTWCFFSKKKISTGCTTSTDICREFTIWELYLWPIRCKIAKAYTS